MGATASYQLSTQCASTTYTLPYAAIATHASQPSLVLTAITTSPYTHLAKPYPGGFVTSMLDYSVYGNGSSTPYSVSGLTGNNRLTISTAVTDMRSCTGVALVPNASGLPSWSEAGVTCTTPSGVNPLSISPGTVSLRATSTGMFGAITGPISTSSASEVQHRQVYRTCMIAANFNTTLQAVCSNDLKTSCYATVNCTGLSNSTCEFQTNQKLAASKTLAAQEERDARMSACNAQGGACQSAGSACTACIADANAKYALVANLPPCTSNCEGQNTEAFQAEETSRIGSTTTVMSSCMANATTPAARRACIDSNVRAELAKTLGTVDNTQLQEYLQGAARNAMATEMASCGAAAGNDAAARAQCVSVNAKNQLATSLGLSASEVTGQLLNKYVSDAARSACGSSITACMQAATTAAERLDCTSGSTLKNTLAQSLGISTESVTAGDLRGFVESSAIDSMKSTLTACMSALNTSSSDIATARATCRTNTACTAVATSLGLEASALSAADCASYLQGAERTEIQDKMSACVSGVDTTLNTTAQRAARKACHSAAKSALALMQGSDASSVSNENMQVYLRDSAMSENVPAIMAACMDAINTSLATSAQESARTACRTTATRAALAESLGLMDDEMSDSEVQEALNTASMQSARKAMKACMGLGQSEQTACISEAKAKVAKVTGSASITELDFVSVRDEGAMDELLTAASSCVTASVSAAACGFLSKYQEGSGLNTTGLSADIQSMAAQRAARKTARYLIKKNMAACKTSTKSDGSSRTNAEVNSCATALNQNVLTTLEPLARIQLIVRDVNRELASSRMKACMQLSGANATSCLSDAQTLMAGYDTENITSIPAWGYFLIALGCLIAIMIPILVLLTTSAKRGRSLSDEDADQEKNTRFLAYSLSQMDQQPGVPIHDQENPPSSSANQSGVQHQDIHVNMPPQ